MHMRLCCRHTLEHATEDAQFSIDIALLQERIAVEVQPSQHLPTPKMLGRWLLFAVSCLHWVVTMTKVADAQR